MVAYREGRPQFLSPGEPSSPLPSGVLFWGSQRLRTWESSVAGPGPGATSPGPLCQASFQRPVSAQVRWGFSTSYPATPLGLGFGFRVQTGLHSSEEACSRLIKAPKSTRQSACGSCERPQVAQAHKAGRSLTLWPPSLPPSPRGPQAGRPSWAPTFIYHCSFHQPRP